MGGGFQEMDGSATDRPEDPVDEADCLRSDGRKLWKEWLQQKLDENKKAVFVSSKTSLDKVNLNSTDYLMGD